MIKIKLPSCLILVTWIALVEVLRPAVSGFHGRRTSTRAIHVTRISHSGSFINRLAPETSTAILSFKDGRVSTKKRTERFGCFVKSTFRLTQK